jgi:hypothetical protein
MSKYMHVFGTGDHFTCCHLIVIVVTVHFFSLLPECPHNSGNYAHTGPPL